MSVIRPHSNRLIQEASLWKHNGSFRPEFADSVNDGEESVWDYTRPPFIEIMNQTVKLFAAKQLIAETDKPIRICETASPPCYYLHPKDFIKGNLIQASGPKSYCEWKGEAVYWNLELAGKLFKHFAWSYPKPLEEYAMVQNLLAIYPNRIDFCELNGERVQAQPGNYYGGWITQNLKGPFKGEPGSQGW